MVDRASGVHGDQTGNAGSEAITSDFAEQEKQLQSESCSEHIRNAQMILHAARTKPNFSLDYDLEGVKRRLEWALVALTREQAAAAEKESFWLEMADKATAADPSQRALL